ncbi:MAG: hypothetical protein VXX30_08730 [Planctomycetota bacterium]|nr:hypothetical protein [Planctomycetota bacterium]
MTQPVVLFTAFEPSGDAHAAPLIEGLRAARPDLEVVAWGGPRMAAAGATLVASTAEDGAMGLGGLARARMLFRERAAMERWLDGRRLVLHVGVDSPSANIRLARISRRHAAPYVQFVAPQFWAWAPWRLRRFRRVAEKVLCILPFEEEWFRSRGMPARYVGHPVVNDPPTPERIAAERASLPLPDGGPRGVLLPGSRRSEVVANMPVLERLVAGLAETHPGLAATVVAAKPELVPLIHAAIPAERADALTVVDHGLHGVLDWADLALCTSGTVSLDLALQRVPMLAIYMVGPVSSLGSRFVLSMPDRLLPNIVAERRVVPEFVPYRGPHEPILQVARGLLGDPARLELMSSALEAVVDRFGDHDPAAESLAELLPLLPDPVAG